MDGSSYEFTKKIMEIGLQIQKKPKKVVQKKSSLRSKKGLYICSVSCTLKIIVQKGVLSASFVHRHFTNVHVRDSVLYPAPSCRIDSFDGT